ncbi:MAG: diaminopimelate epimerase [Candidatus Paceibacterota bacterium]
MHGLGNDFIVIDNFAGRIKFSKEQIIFLCDRHKGIGADGLILVEKNVLPSGEDLGGADCFMNYNNADGTQAEICGNGLRCVAGFLKSFYFKEKEKFRIKTRAGMKEINLEKDGMFSVNIGKPVFLHEDFPEKELELEGLLLNFVSMGNPHAVAFVEDINIFNLEKIGPIIENNSVFPNKINLEIVEKINDKEFKVKVWERGCGETLACGTGACAVFAVLNKNKKKKEEIIINLPGGQLFISENKDGEIIMRGEAKSVFSGMFEID